MAEIRKEGAPTKKTEGVVGDIYIDTATGIEYKCTFSYRDPFFKELECEWRPTGNRYPKGMRPEAVLAEEVIPKQSKEDILEEVKEPAKDEKPKYVNYSKHHKKAK